MEQDPQLQQARGQSPDTTGNRSRQPTSTQVPNGPGSRPLLRKMWNGTDIHTYPNRVPWSLVGKNKIFRLTYSLSKRYKPDSPKQNYKFRHVYRLLGKSDPTSIMNPIV